jgi:hypothetical protein
MAMELRINVVLLSLLACAWAGLSVSEPVAALEPGAPETRALASLEDEFAAHPGDLRLARALSAAYLDVGRPGLAVATLRAADPTLLEDPTLAHRLAQAYERSGRVLDALATADLALQRCARALGSDDASHATPVPRFGCSERTYASLDVHRSALGHMVRWGVAEPASDSRTAKAYRLATRSATLAVATE